VEKVLEFKKNRALSFIIITLVYVIATAVGFVVYHYTPCDFWLKLLIADVAGTVVTFIFSLVFKNSSVYDPYWSVLPIIVVVFYAIFNGVNLLSLLMLIAICIWGLRLTANWAYTFKNLTHQDWRYTMLKEKTGAFYPLINFLGIHLFPTLVVYGCILPTVFAFQTILYVNAGSIIFLCVSLLAVVLQGTADCQMHYYRKHKTTPFIRIGLWKYSRHPNYLGEILMWWGIALSFICACPQMWYLLAGALVNTIMFLVVSVPMADKRQSKKDGFNEYKKQTFMLLPIKK
jgi:steroid 5-alpha reductase family enzyme